MTQAPTSAPSGRLDPRAERWALAAGAATGALLALGPLEVRDAAVAVGALRFTSTELLAALALLVGLISAAIAGRHDAALRTRMIERLRAPVAAAMVLWGLLHVMSTAWATVWPLEALKFSLRVCGGVGLGLVGLAWGGESSYVRRAMVGLRIGVALITVVGCIERLGGQAVEPALAMFRDEPTWMLGEQRLSTVFGHANTLAAYLELTVPVLLLLAARTSSAWRWPARFWLVLAILMLSLTYSRAGLLAGLLGLVCVGYVAYRRHMQEVGRHVIGAALLLAVSYLGNPDMRGRLGIEERRYDVIYRLEAPCAGAPGERVEVPIFVRNEGQWPLTNRQAPGDLAVVQLPDEGPPDSKDFHYLPLPELGPGEGVTMTVAFDLPEEPRWQPLLVDIRRKNVLWLSSVGVEPGHFVCRVAAKGQALPPRGVTGDHELRFEHRPMELERRDYWSAAIALFSESPLVGHGADRFRQLYGRHVPLGGWDSRARAHSILFETAANLGLVGLAALLFLAITVGARMARAFGYRDLGRVPVRPLGVALAGSLIGFGLHSLVDYFLAYTKILVVVWPLLGIAMARAAPPSQRDDTPPSTNDPGPREPPT